MPIVLYAKENKKIDLKTQQGNLTNDERPIQPYQHAFQIGNF